MIRSHSCFSIGKSKRGGYETKNTPGPAAYSPEKKQNIEPPEYQFGKFKRIQNYGNEYVPGPGQYDSHEAEIHKISHPQYTFGLKCNQTANSFLAQVPGPGVYEQDQRALLRTNPSFTMRLKPRGNIGSYITPGPNHYAVTDFTHKSSNKYRIGNELRKPLSTVGETPGPGAYEYGTTKPDATQIRFGTFSRDRATSQNMITPGPGSYDIPTRINDKGKTLHKKWEDIPSKMMLKRTPGPAHYTPDKLPTNCFVKIGRANRSPSTTTQTAGPGQYDQDPKQLKPKFPAWQFGTGQRKNLTQTETTPGPDNYEIKYSEMKAPQHFIAQKIKYTDQVELQRVPGPGQYEPTLNQTKRISEKFLIGKGRRTDFTRTGQVTPGPANYDIDRNPKDIPHRFGSSIRKPLNTVVTPGPGQYNQDGFPGQIGNVNSYCKNSSGFRNKSLYSIQK